MLRTSAARRKGRTYEHRPDCRQGILLQGHLRQKLPFFIPRYQRPYAWTTEHTEELLDDLWSAFTADGGAVEDMDPYFLGSIVLIKKEHHPRAEVIDGQQRLTTLTILLSVFRHLLPHSADAISDYLRQKGKPLEGLRDEFRLTLRPQDAGFFEKHIQRESGLVELEKINAPALPNDAQRNIRGNALSAYRVDSESHHG